MEIKSLNEDTASLVPNIVNFYHFEFKDLRGFSPKQIYNLKKSRNEEYFKKVINRESSAMIDLLIDGANGLEGILEFKEDLDNTGDVRILFCDILWVLVKDKGIGYGSRLLQNRIDKAGYNMCDLINLVVPMPSMLPIELWKKYDFRYVTNRDEKSKIYCKTLTDAGIRSLER